MATGKEVNVRLQDDLLNQVEEHQAKLIEDAGDGVRISLSDAVRNLIHIGIHAAAADARKGRR